MAKRSVLVTGAAKRIGAQICHTAHVAGFDIALHYHHSEQEAQDLASTLNKVRRDSCRLYQANLQSEDSLTVLADQILEAESGLYALVNNASLYESQPFTKTSGDDWQRMIGTNLRAPWLLSQQLATRLADNRGAIINILDSHSRAHREHYALYDLSKNGLGSLTRSLARELAPDVRVNGIAPGAILWPENEHAGEASREDFVSAIPMQRLGEPSDIADAALFLLDKAPYVTGQILCVDGGRSLED